MGKRWMKRFKCVKKACYSGWENISHINISKLSPSILSILYNNYCLILSTTSDLAKIDFANYHIINVLDFTAWSTENRRQNSSRDLIRSYFQTKISRNFIKATSNFCRITFSPYFLSFPTISISTYSDKHSFQKSAFLFMKWNILRGQIHLFNEFFLQFSPTSNQNFQLSLVSKESSNSLV